MTAWLRVEQQARGAVGDGVTPALSFRVLRGVTVEYALDCGRLGIEADAPPTRQDTVFDLASLTKPLTTWLWAVRAYPTRTAATDGCNGGHVRVNAVAAKPATMVQVGDRITVKGHGHERVFEVVRIIDKRVGAPVAVECYVDHSPPPPERDPNPPMFTRDRATGRPTKKDRRQMDRFRRG